MKPGVVAGLLAAALVIGGCSNDTDVAEPVVVERSYPFGPAGLVVHGDPAGAPDGLRRLAQSLVELVGVAATEADYEAKVVRISLVAGISDADRSQLSARLGSWPGVTEVTPGP